MYLASPMESFIEIQKQKEFATVLSTIGVQEAKYSAFDAALVFGLILTVKFVILNLKLTT